MGLVSFIKRGFGRGPNPWNVVVECSEEGFVLRDTDAKEDDSVLGSACWKDVWSVAVGAIDIVAMMVSCLELETDKVGKDSIIIVDERMEGFGLLAMALEERLGLKGMTILDAIKTADTTFEGEYMDVVWQRDS